MDFASNAACGVEGNRFAAAVRITLIMLLAAERRGGNNKNIIVEIRIISDKNNFARTPKFKFLL